MTWRGRRFLVERDDAEIILPPPEEPVLGNDLPGSLEPVASRFSGADFKEVVDLVATCSSAMLDAMESLANPDSASIEFGVKVVGEFGLPMLTKLSSEGTIKVTVTWKRGEAPDKSSE
jgi:hypothetical protein